MNSIDTFFSLKKEQKEAIGILQIGTFLEYFDLLLYIHMTVLLNDLFFPKTDPHTAKLLTALSFCSVFVLRPFGALIFGYIGDTIGRKTTVVITTIMMSISCLTMFILPTYEQIGIAASWIVIICRMTQGLSSMGEVIGAELYLTESIKRPAIFPVVGLITISLTLGGVAALAIASLATSYGFNWRYAFLIGAVIAVIGAAARTRLRETPDFVDAKRKIKATFDRAGIDNKILQKNSIYNEKPHKMLPIAYFLLECSAPVCFYLVFGYSSHILKDILNCSPEQIIHQNFIAATTEFLALIFVAFLSYKIYPLKILKVKLIIFAAFILACPYLLSNVSSPSGMLIIQSLILVLGVSVFPASPIFYSHFPIFKRFTYTGFAYALSRITVHLITSFGFIYLIEYFGYYGILIIMVPVLIGFTFGLYYFERLEREKGNIPA